MRMEVLEKGDANVWIRLEGRLDLKGIEEIELAFTVRAGRSERPVLVDLADVTYVGSLGIGMLFAAARNVRLRRAVLVLYGATPHVEEVLRIGGLGEVAGIVSNQEDALRAVAAA
ncbi:MAG: STAS domain-containing protein [Holophagales bacterium]|nr:STAS domain-containing protein [Holophagales bacterium]